MSTSPYPFPSFAPAPGAAPAGAEEQVFLAVMAHYRSTFFGKVGRWDCT